MPYIKYEDRPALTPFPIANVAGTAGELNFQITRCLIAYWKIHKRNYQTVNDIIGALEGAKLEFYRRVAAPYEDTKIKENGDVYD